MNAIEMLKKDHEKVDELFKKVKANEDGDNSDVFVKIKAELDVHAHIEGRSFIRGLSKMETTNQKNRNEGIEEHSQMKCPQRT